MTDWNPENYDENFKFVSDYGEDLVMLLSPQQDEEILDLGCGTGDLSYRIAQEGAIVTGIDASKEMIEAAKIKFPGLDFFHRSAEDLNIKNKYDAVFSNAVFHWIENQDKIVKNIYESLKENGRIIIEFGGKGNCQTIIDALKQVVEKHKFKLFNTFYFKSISEFTTTLEKNGFVVDYAVLFDRETELVGEDGMKNWLKGFLKRMLKNVPTKHHEKILDEVVEIVRPKLYVNGKWYADYKRLRVSAGK